MLFSRFSSNGLAAAYVDLLTAGGVDAKVEFRPRSGRDPSPFCVQMSGSRAVPLLTPRERASLELGPFVKGGTTGDCTESRCNALAGEQVQCPLSRSAV